MAHVEYDTFSSNHNFLDVLSEVTTIMVFSFDQIDYLGS